MAWRADGVEGGSVTSLAVEVELRGETVLVSVEIFKTQWGWEMEDVVVIDHPDWDLDTNEMWHIKEAAIELYKEG